MKMSNFTVRVCNKIMVKAWRLKPSRTVDLDNRQVRENHMHIVFHRMTLLSYTALYHYNNRELKTCKRLARLLTCLYNSKL